MKFGTRKWMRIVVIFIWMRRLSLLRVDHFMLFLYLSFSLFHILCFFCRTELGLNKLHFFCLIVAFLWHFSCRRHTKHKLKTRIIIKGKIIRIKWTNAMSLKNGQKSFYITNDMAVSEWRCYPNNSWIKKMKTCKWNVFIKAICIRCQPFSFANRAKGKNVILLFTIFLHYPIYTNDEEKTVLPIVSEKNPTKPLFSLRVREREAEELCWSHEI